MKFRHQRNLKSRNVSLIFRTLITKAEPTTVSNSIKKKSEKRKSATAEGAETPEKVQGGQVGDDVSGVTEATAIDGNSKKQKKKGKNGMAGSVESASETSDALNSYNMEIEPKKKKMKKSQ